MLIALALSLSAHAEDPTFAGTKAAAKLEAPETKLSANAGGTFAAGNSESFSFNAGLDFSHKWSANQLGLIGGAAIGFGAVDANADGFLAASERCLGVAGRPCSPTAERYALEGRYDRFFSEKSSLYLLAGGYHDKFAGFDLRAHVQLGYALHLIDSDTTTLKVEAGADLANETYVEGVVPAATKLVAAQIASALTHSFNKNVSFTDALTIYEPVLTQPDGSPFAPHFTDLRITNVAGINSKVSDKFSITLADTFAWRNEPIAAPDGITETRSPVDNTLTIALVASIL